MAEQKKEVASSSYSREYFLTCNDGFEEFRQGYNLSYMKKKELSLLDIHPGVKLLDIGFGRGEMLYHCEKLGASVYGIDFSDEARLIAKEVVTHSPQASIVQADCAGLPFKDGFFNRVLVSDLIEHVSFEKGIKVMQEAYRVLAPGGFFLLHTSPNILFMKCVYPLVMFLVDKEKRKQILKHVEMQSKVHINEYHYFSLRKLAQHSGIKARVWIDRDFTRGGTFRHVRRLNRTQSLIIGLITLLEKGIFWPVRLFLGNDIWMSFVKA